MNKIQVAEIQDRTLQMFIALEKKEKEFYPKTKKEWELYFKNRGLHKDSKSQFFSLLKKFDGDVDKTMDSLKETVPDISEKLKDITLKDFEENFVDSLSEHKDLERACVFILQIKSISELFIK